MTTQEKYGYKTANLRPGVWQRLLILKAKNPLKKQTLSDVIESVLEQNKKLKKKLIGGKDGSDDKDSSEE